MVERAQESARLTKQERRARAREEARRLREEQAKREARNRRILISVIVGFVALVASVGVMVVMNSGKSPFEGIASPEGSDAHGGIPVGATLAAGEVGEGTRVDVFSDYTCYWCEVFEGQHGEDMRDMVSGGDAQYWIHPVAIMDGSGDFSGYSGLAVNASATVAQHAPDQWLDFHAALFAAYSEAAAQAQSEAGVTEPGLEEIEQAAASVGVPDSVIARLAGGEFREWTEATTRDFIRERSRAATPEIQVAGTVLENWTDEGALRSAIKPNDG